MKSSYHFVWTIQLLAWSVSSFSPVIVPIRLVNEIKNDSSRSSLFRKQYGNGNSIHRYVKENDDEEVKALSSKPDAPIDEETRNEPKTKEQSGFLTALFLGPPLIAKFAIVLVVKFLTDLVVFPLLVLYRICKSVKYKTLNLLRSSDLSGDSTNGAKS